jgi:hypothetical protein
MHNFATRVNSVADAGLDSSFFKNIFSLVYSTLDPSLAVR